MYVLTAGKGCSSYKRLNIVVKVVSVVMVREVVRVLKILPLQIL